MKIKYNKKLIQTAKGLRADMTKQEKHLWYDFLQHYPVHVYKQRVIENYIADFYCPSAKLIIEIDGSQHYTKEGIEYDEIRTEILEQYGLKVLRIANIDVDNNFIGICETIHDEIENRTNKIKRGL
jgi:very-short-patch-repair endonuclease